MTDSYFDWVRTLFDPARIHEKPEALRGIRVLDLSMLIFGPATADFLGELGAEVIKVELPGRGDTTRILGPPAFFWKNVPVTLFGMNHSKYHVGIDMHRPEGQELIRRLAARADVLIEGFAPGYLDSLGIGYRQLSELNPRLIYVACSTYGQFGPGAPAQPAEHDLLDQALSGLLHITGDPAGPPMRVGSWIGAYAQAAWGCLALLGALHWREGLRGRADDRRLGRGRAHALPRVHGAPLPHHGPGAPPHRAVRAGRLPVHLRPRQGRLRLHRGLHGCELPGVLPHHGRPGLAQDPRFDSTLKRATMENEAALLEEIERWSRNFTAEEILEQVLADPGPGVVVFGPVNPPSRTLAETHWWERGCLRIVDDPLFGRLLLQMPVWRMTRTPPRLNWACRPAGYHNGHVYQKHFGLGPGRLAELKAQGIL